LHSEGADLPWSVRTIASHPSAVAGANAANLAAAGSGRSAFHVVPMIVIAKDARLHNGMDSAERWPHPGSENCLVQACFNAQTRHAPNRVLHPEQSQQLIGLGRAQLVHEIAIVE